VGAEGVTTRERLEQRDTERELIGRRCDGLTQDLLGRHVARRPRPCESAALRRRRHRHAEVHHANPTPRVDHHVPGLEVAMHQSRPVGRRQPVSRAGERAEDVGPGAGRSQPLAQGLAVDELHGHEHRLAHATDVEHADHVGIGEASERAGLRHQRRGRIRVVRLQELDGDPTVELGIVGGVHDAHAAGADALEHGVAGEEIAAGQRRVGMPRTAVGDLGGVTQGILAAHVRRVGARQPDASLAGRQPR
jgi:hypothetical protein